MISGIKRVGGVFLRILAVIADFIAVASILSFNSARQNSFTIYLTPLFAFAIWSVSLFTYVGLLQRYWLTHYESKNYQSTLGGFIRRDLVRGFREPFLLLPAVVFAFLLVWIFLELLLSAVWLQTALGIAALLGVIIGIAILWTNALKVDLPSTKVRRDVNKNWNKWERAIQAKLARKRWLTEYDIAELGDQLGVESMYLGYALSKYAVEHPKQTAYGFIFRRKDDMMMTSSRVLISLKNLPEEEFYYSGSIVY